MILISNILVWFSHLAVSLSELGLFGLHLVELLLGSFYLSHISNEIRVSCVLSGISFKISSFSEPLCLKGYAYYVFSLTLIHSFRKSWWGLQLKANTTPHFIDKKLIWRRLKRLFPK